MEIPDSVSQAMRDGYMTYQKLLARQNAMHKYWHKEQLVDLTLLVDVMSATYNALNRLIDANTKATVSTSPVFRRTNFRAR
jgi:hypothetical protein